MTRKETDKPKRRAKIKDLPATDKKLDNKKMKRVKGGYSFGATQTGSFQKVQPATDSLVMGKGPIPS